VTGAPIFIALVVTNALLLWLLIKTRGHWALRFGAILFVLVFTAVAWYSIESYRGWPTTSSLPKRVVFLSAVIHEPTTQDRGSIDLWAVPLEHGFDPLGYHPSQYEPRAYRMRYSEPLERAVLNAQKLRKSGHGRPVELDLSPSKNKINSSSGRRIPKWAVRFYRLPHEQTPRKERS